MTYVLDVPYIAEESQEETLGRIALRARAQWRQNRLSAIFFSTCSFTYIAELVTADSTIPAALLLVVVVMLILMVLCTVRDANTAIRNRLVIDWATDWIRRILVSKTIIEEAERGARAARQEKIGNLLSKHQDPEQLG